MSPETQLRARNLRTLALLAALFLTPLLLAFLSYYGGGWRPAGRVNHGTLISPARLLPQVSLRGAGAAQPAGVFHGQWSLVYLDSGECAADCRRALYLARQVRLALNADMTRIARVYLAGPDCPACAPLTREDPGLAVLQAEGEGAARLLGEFPAAGRATSLFVVDPLGNLMMSYDAGGDPHGLLEDLKKLLKLSHIG